MTFLSSRVVSPAKLLGFLHSKIGIAVALFRTTCSIPNARAPCARSAARRTLRSSSLRVIGPCVDAAPADTRGPSHACGRVPIAAAAKGSSDEALLLLPFVLPIADAREHTLMPHNMICPKCGTWGLVRVEHIIRGDNATRAYDCGACEHAWTTPDSPPPVKPAQPLWSSKTRRIGPKSRRPSPRSE